MREVLEEIGFTAADEKAILEGEIIVRDAVRLSDNEIVTAAGLRVPVPFSRFVRDLKRGGSRAEVSQRLLAHGRVRIPIDPSEWSAASFDSSETAELQRFLEAEPGLDLNLSGSEIATLRQRLAGRDASGPGAATAVSRAYRDILQARFQAYHGRGLGGIEPYDRGKGTTASPAEELRRVWEVENDFLEARFPAFTRAVGSYPEGQVPEINNEFYWVKEDFQGRPAFSLEHLTWQTGPDFALASSRQFFVGHTYNSQQLVGLFLPHEDDTLFFFFNSTRTDLVARYVRRVALPIGQSIMRREVGRYLLNVRADGTRRLGGGMP